MSNIEDARLDAVASGELTDEDLSMSWLSRLAHRFRTNHKYSERLGLAITAVGVAVTYFGLIDGAIMDRSMSVSTYEMATGVVISATGLTVMAKSGYIPRVNNSGESPIELAESVEA